MSQILTSPFGKIKISCITSDKKHGTWWAIGTRREWVEIRTTRTGRIRLFDIKKGLHPYFTVERPK